MIRPPLLESRRRPLAEIVMLAGFVVFVGLVSRHVPLTRWLFFHYSRALAGALVFSLACLAAGHALLVRLLGRLLPLDEHVAIALPLGVLCFFLTSFAFGVVGLYGAPFFWLGPALLLVLGGRASLRTARRVYRHRRVWLTMPAPTRLSIAVFGFGSLGLVALWLTILTPHNPSVDARWYHLPIAEHYVARGGIVPFKEGWVLGAFPQLASLIYVWPFSAPGALFDKIVGAAHLELAMFLFTLQGICAVVRRISGQRSPLAWTAIWLFPGIFCYDSGLVLGSDHVAALWAAPLCLLTLRYWRAPEKTWGLLLGAIAAAALDTKYTAVILLPLVVATVAVRAALDLSRQKRLAALLPAWAAFVAGVVLTAPHWLKNAVFYGDPLFPMLRRWLPTAFWSPAAETPYRAWFSLLRPSFSWAAILELSKTLAAFSFVPHDFKSFHGDVPVFGSLFTLVTPLLLLLRRPPRLVWVFAAAYAGIATWFWIHQFDRYLQALVPWMTAATVVVLAAVWRAGGWSRFSVAALVALQVVWGADVMFMPSHHAAGGTLPKVIVDLFASAWQPNDRFEVDAAWQGVAAALPPRAIVLVHEEEVHLGLGAAAVLDSPGEQGLLYWGEPGAASSREVWQRLRAQAVTHLVWSERVNRGFDTVAGALSFYELAARHSQRLGTFGGLVLAKLNDAPPVSADPGLVAYYPCPADAVLAPGLYPLTALARPLGDPRPRPLPQAAPPVVQAAEQARFVVLDARCHGRLSKAMAALFEPLAARGQAQLLLRRAAEP
jgi:hypothetical protein